MKKKKSTLGASGLTPQQQQNRSKPVRELKPSEAAGNAKKNGFPERLKSRHPVLPQGLESEPFTPEKDSVSEASPNVGDLREDLLQEFPSDLLPLLQQLASLPAETRANLNVVLASLIQRARNGADH